MLDCTNHAFNLLEEGKGIKVTMDDLQNDDLDIFKVIQRADTMGTFQIECRAEVLMLPRVKPQPLYDLEWR